jgi:hypothetical protein
MSAQIIKMPDRAKSNGAREAMAEVVAILKSADADNQTIADQTLMHLAARGFILVPFEDHR